MILYCFAIQSNRRIMDLDYNSFPRIVLKPSTGMHTVLQSCYMIHQPSCVNISGFCVGIRPFSRYKFSHKKC